MWYKLCISLSQENSNNPYILFWIKSFSYIKKYRLKCNCFALVSLLNGYVYLCSVLNSLKIKDSTLSTTVLSKKMDFSKGFFKFLLKWWYLLIFWRKPSVVTSSSGSNFKGRWKIFQLNFPDLKLHNFFLENKIL